MTEQITEKKTPEQLGAEIQEYLKISRVITLRCGVEIGKRLIEAKKILKHGEWLPWLNEQGINSRTAAHYMKLFREYGEEIEEENKNAGQPGAWAQMSISQAAELMAIPKLERKTFAKEIDALQLSVREMKEEIRKKYEEQNADKPVNTIARNIELKPCPFCGGEGELMISGRTQPNGNIKGYIIVKCTICGAAGKGQCYYGPNVDQWDHDLEESIGGEKAVSAWNMRWKE